MRHLNLKFVIIEHSFFIGSKSLITTLKDLQVQSKSNLVFAQFFGYFLKLVLGDESVVVLVEDLEGHLGLVGGLATASNAVFAFFHLKCFQKFHSFCYSKTENR